MTFSLANCAKDYLFHCRHEKNLSGKSIKAYTIDLTQFIAFVEQKDGGSAVELADKIILREYIKHLSEGNKPKTVKRKAAALKAFFNYLEFEDIIVVNPFRKMKIKIKEGNRLPKTIARHQIIRLFRHIYQIRDDIKDKKSFKYRAVVRDIAVFELLFSTGIRVAELCNLKKNRTDLKRGSIRIIGKGNKERVIPICSQETISALKEYSTTLSPDVNNLHYFANRLHNRLSEQSVRFMIKKYTKELRFEESVTPHMFRHSVATLLLEKGVDIRHIQIFLGHSSISTTQIYVQVNESAQRKVLMKKHPRQSFGIFREKHQPILTNEG